MPKTCPACGIFHIHIHIYTWTCTPTHKHAHKHIIQIHPSQIESRQVVRQYDYRPDDPLGLDMSINGPNTWLCRSAFPCRLCICSSQVKHIEYNARGIRRILSSQTHEEKLLWDIDGLVQDCSNSSALAMPTSFLYEISDKNLSCMKGILLLSHQLMVPCQ